MNNIEEKLEFKQKVLLAITLLSINLLFFINSRYLYSSNDGSHFALTKALADDHSVIIDKYVRYTLFIDVSYKDGHYYSDRSPGNAFLALPFYFAGKQIENSILLKNFLKSKNIEQVFIHFLPQLAGTLSVFLMFRVCMIFTGIFSISLITSICYALASLNFLQFTQFLSHAVTTALIQLATFLALSLWRVSPSKIVPTVTALFTALAIASITEIHHIICVPVFIVYLYYFFSQQQHHITQIQLKAFCYGAFIFFLIYSILIFYNYMAFGEISIKSNKYSLIWLTDTSFSSVLSGIPLKGLYQIFLKFGVVIHATGSSLDIQEFVKGHLVTTPILYISFFGYNFFLKKHRAEALFFIGMLMLVIGTLALHVHALPRHISSMIPILFLPLVFVLQKIYQETILTKNDRYSTNKFIWIAIACVVLGLTLLSIYWNFKYNIENPFLFIAELKTYFFFYLSAFGIIVLIHKFKRLCQQYSIKKNHNA